MVDSNDNNDFAKPRAVASKPRPGTRDKLSAAYDSARERTSAATQRAAEAPLSIVAGGIALGAIAGALLPRTEREVETLGPLGRKLGDAASNAVRAARDAGKEELGLFTGTTSPLQAIVDKALGAVTAAGGAAAKSVRGARESESQES